MSVLQAQAMPYPQPRSGEVTDRELVEQAIRNPADFLDIFQRYRDPVHRYCYRCLGSREAAEDATQTIFMKAFAHLRSYQNKDQFRSWLFTIAHNVIIDFRRASRPEASLEWVDQVVDPAVSPEDQAIATSEVLRVTGLLHSLPDAQREVVELRLQGFTDKEIAQILGKTHGAVRAAQHRALVQLQALMNVETAKEPGHVAT